MMGGGKGRGFVSLNFKKDIDKLRNILEFGIAMGNELRRSGWGGVGGRFC